jgi:dihydrofolate reductase
MNVDNLWGDGGRRLHKWMFEKPDTFEKVHKKMFEGVGAVIMGKNIFLTVEKPWGDNPPYHMPVFVLSHKPREKIIKKGGTSFTFVTDGSKSALKQAKTIAVDKDIIIAGGANTVQQYMNANLLDEIRIHLITVLFGRGIRLFDTINGKQIEMELLKVIKAPGVNHLEFQIIK